MATQASTTATANTSIAVSTVGLDPMSYRTLANFMLAVPGAVMAASINGYSGAEREVARAGDKARTRICFIDYDQNPEQAVWVTEHLRNNNPDVHVFAVSANTEPERIVVAMRVGCAEYLLKPLLNDRVLDGMARVDAKQKERTRSKVRGKVITLIGAKGGTGVTSLALHLALDLTGPSQRKCLLVDQHSALGDASLYLGTGRHQYSFYELANNTDRLDQELLQGFLLRHSSGLHVLDSPETVDVVRQASPSAIEHTLSFLAEIYQFVVVDCPPGLTDVTLACIAQSDQIAIVLTAELPSIRNAVRYIEHLERVGYNSGKIQIVLNRHSKRSPLDDERVEKALGRKIAVRVPNAYNEVIRAINAGAPIASGKSDFGAAIQSWARAIASNPGDKAMAQAHTGGVMSIFGR
ncbi:MAG TPA: AAA family ATPase [Candidatus Dormibacteraeota bacterium]|nr:AAA family ATPase [Candidatus Dormibacteraeota bacterium]